MSPIVSVVITTRNRRAEVLRAIESCLAQDYEQIEVLVYDDASTDDTSAEIRRQFSNVRLITGKERRGLIYLRSQGFEDARGNLVLSLDDDAYFTGADTVTRVVELFCEFPKAAAVALPYLEPTRDPGQGFMTAIPPGTPLRSYIGCAHAIRRPVALEAGKYRDFLVHQGEERDLCLRLLGRGHQVIYGDTPPLVHLPSSSRDRQRINYFGYRNTLLFTGLNVPHPFMIPRMLIDSAQLLRHRFQWRTLPQRVAAILAGWKACWTYRRERRPVSLAAYRSYRSLPGHGPIVWEGPIPAPATRATSPISGRCPLTQFRLDV